MKNFLRYRKIYYAFSGLLIVASLYSLFSFGLNLGIDFTGGSIMEVEFQNTRPQSQEVQEALQDIDLGSISLQITGEKGLILRMKSIDEATHQFAIEKLNNNWGVTEKRFEMIGPAIGRELQQKTKTLIALSLLAIILYVALSFRRISRPLLSWHYGVVTAFVALFHNILIPLGAFAVLGELFEIQITIPIVVGLLTVFGYSINDTIVVFDRIRENLIKKSGVTYEDTVNLSLNQTLVRSVNTSLTTLFVLGSLFFLGGESLKYFAFVLILGIVLGTYSSLFVASPILVTFKNFRSRKFS
ncbi:protein translocase subunit SecF [Patescibacteria group bacterium]